MAISTQPPKASKQSLHPLARRNLVRWAFLFYLLVIVYATLHPAESMRWTEANPLAFFSWSKIVWVGHKPYGLSPFDALSNCAAYVPFGFLLMRLFVSRISRPIALLGVFGTAILISLCLEALQTFNPVRVPSLWDVIFNSFGALFGAFLALFVSIMFRNEFFLTRTQSSSMLAPHAGAIWAVLGLWGLAQLHPQKWVFATAPLSTLWDFGIPSLPLAGLKPQALSGLETIVACLAMASFLGLVRVGSSFKGRHLPAKLVWMSAAWVALLLWQWFAYMVQYGPNASLAQWSEGVWLACWMSAVVALLWAVTPTATVAVLTVFAIGSLFVLTQILPSPPYINAPSMWQYGQFTHLYGVTAAVSSLWTILATAALVLQLRYLKLG